MPAVQPTAAPPTRDELRTRDLDAIVNSPALARATMAVRVESLASGAVLYARDDERLVVPASNLKILTLAAAAHRLGWNFRYRTSLELAGEVANGTLEGDLVVRSTGDPSIGSLDAGHAALFLEWADALERAGVRRIVGRVIGDDDDFDDEPFGAGWSLDYLSAGYAAPSGALSYNENVVVVRVTPGEAPGAPADVVMAPPGHSFELVNEASTGPVGSPATLTVERTNRSQVVVRGRVPASGPMTIRTVAVENPTVYFVDALVAALASRSIHATGGTWDIDDVANPPTAARRPIATHESAPLSALIGYAMKTSQNFYGEMILKTLGTSGGAAGSAERGRQAVQAVLSEWRVPPDATVIYDGSGLSRNNYATAHAIVTTLKAVWNDERLRGPFVASLPVGGRDGTLQSRMRNTDLDRRVQAKTGTINNVRALSGYVETARGEKLVFSMIANHFTAPAAEIDAVMERVLMRVIED
jgi:D-alanyl-D-alanine carboxypeptidase/D-alanyl-D-alanine-endopeptidase (penicillin-binding protein 4)